MVYMRGCYSINICSWKYVHSLVDIYYKWINNPYLSLMYAVEDIKFLQCFCTLSHRHIYHINLVFKHHHRNTYATWILRKLKEWWKNAMIQLEISPLAHKLDNSHHTMKWNGIGIETVKRGHKIFLDICSNCWSAAHIFQVYCFETKLFYSLYTRICPCDFRSFHSGNVTLK